MFDLLKVVIADLNNQNQSFSDHKSVSKEGNKEMKADKIEEYHTIISSLREQLFFSQ